MNSRKNMYLMKNSTTILLLCFLFAFAQGQEIVNWAGNWDIKATTSADACYPDKTILISQAVGTITASWTWANSKPCQAAGIAHQEFTQTKPTPQGNAIDFKIKVGIAVIDGIWTVIGDEAIFASNNEASSSYSRRQQMMNWPGVWDIVTQDPNSCNPDGAITITQDRSSLTASWTWANTLPCTYAGLAGKTFSRNVYIPSGNAVSLKVQVGNALIDGLFAVIQDKAIFASANGASATFVRRQENTSFEGIWTLKTTSSDASCYPVKEIVITQSNGNTVASWTWGDSNPCKYMGLDGKTFSQTQPTPKGKSIYLDIVVGAARVAGLFTVNGENGVFASINGASATFIRTGKSVKDVLTEIKNYW